LIRSIDAARDSASRQQSRIDSVAELCNDDQIRQRDSFYICFRPTEYFQLCSRLRATTVDLPNAPQPLIALLDRSPLRENSHLVTLA